MNRLQLLLNTIAPKRIATFNSASFSFSCGTKKVSNRFKSTSNSKISSQDAGAKEVSSDLNLAVVEISILVSRGLAAFGILHVVTEYGVDLTRCEGPSMLPTINSHGEIIVIEKMSHRIYGIEGGSRGEKRAKDSRSRQKEWEKEEHKMFLANSERKGVYEPTWYKQKPLEANHINHKKLSSLLQRISRFTSGINVGDVIVVEHPEREGTVCKRVLGLPGDMILKPQSPSTERRDVMKLFKSTDGIDIENSNVAILNESSMEIVPDGHIWVEGDNDTNSADSRTYGPVPSALVVGKVWLRVWPLRGNSLIVRGGRPMPPKHVPFTGSTAVPAGCKGEKRVNACNLEVQK